MGRMKELLDQRLEENKYDMWEVLQVIKKTQLKLVEDRYLILQKANQILTRIEKGDTCETCHYQESCELTGDLVHWCKSYVIKEVKVYALESKKSSKQGD